MHVRLNLVPKLLYEFYDALSKHIVNFALRIKLLEI